jgi:hypothetical protein
MTKRLDWDRSSLGRPRDHPHRPPILTPADPDARPAVTTSRRDQALAGDDNSGENRSLASRSR